MGVPDLRGGLGTSTFYSSEEGINPQESENVVNVKPDTTGAIRTYIIGPRNSKTRSDFRFEISVHVDSAGKKIVIRSEGQPNELEVREGEWSEWLKVKFKTGMLQSVKGMVRFYLVQTGPVFELYASPVNFDAGQPLFPISSPPEYASELAGAVGTFYTTGMVEDHGGLTNERFDEFAFMDQCHDVLREREKMMLYELDRLDEGFFFCLFDTPDRLAHMFWRFGEIDHPANRGMVSSELTRVIEEHYRECDAVVGKAMEYTDDQTLLIVLSDHGMNSFQRGVHLNTWLYDNGLLALQSGAKPGEDAGDFFHSVDWDRTRAYAVGLGSIYLNLKGREERGIVDEAEMDALKSKIINGLSGMPDANYQRVAVQSVVAREQVYNGPYADESPDLLVNFSEGYRVSWDTALGGVPAGHFEDNVKKWGGDHIIDPCLVPGVLFMNQRFTGERASLLDLAPTILDALDVPKGENMEGNALLI